MHIFTGLSKLRRRRRGFALVSTLLLMVLLTLLAVSILQLGSISLRTSSRDEAREEARSNAMVALQMAIAQLQVTAGPDQRITGPAELASAEYPAAWTGVWTPGAVAGNDLAPAIAPVTTGRRNYLVDARAKFPTWKSDWFIEPLVSPDTPGATLVILGRWSDSGRVEVPEVRVGATGGLAWWTEDLSQQASLASGVNAEDAGEFGLSAAPRNDTAQITGGALPSDFFKTTDERRKAISLESAYLAGQTRGSGTLGNSGNERSYGLFTDPVRGGFKFDMTRFVESQSRVMGELPAYGLEGITAKSSIIPGTHHAKTGPQWERLRHWFQLPGAADRKLKGANPEIVRQAVDAPAGEGWSIDAVRSNRLPLHPMVVDAGFHWDFTPVTAAANSIRVHIFPRLTLWNPYNAELTGKRYVIVMPRQIDTGGGLMVEMESPTGATSLVDVINGWGEQFNAPGQANERYFMFTVEPTTFGPGECLVFTPKTPAGALSPYSPGNPAANLLTASQPIGLENFYIEKTSNPTLPQRLAQGFRVKRYVSGTTSFHNLYLNWRPMPFLLKAAPDTGAISAEQVLQSPAYPTLQRLYLNDAGAGEGGWTLPKGASYLHVKTDWNNTPMNNGSSWDVFHVRRRPPRSWHYRVHLSWIDDETELASVPAGSGTQPPYAAAIMADWNPLASVVCRTPSTYLKEHFDLHVGCWYHCKAAYDAYGLDNNWGIFAKGKARGCPYGDPRNHASKLSFPLIDIPQPGLPLQSIGTLRNVPLSPWTWHPAKPIGSSRPSLHADKDATAIPAIALQANPWDSTITQGGARVFNDLVQASDSRGEILLYDLSFEANRELWDATFASSWALAADWDGIERLPNRQYVPHPGVRDPARAITLSKQSPSTFGLWLPAYLLASEGAFNVNSISPTAWAAVLGGLKDLVRNDVAGQPIEGDHPFAKFRHPASGEPKWGGGLGLSDKQIVDLAEKIVEVVKERGPFLGMADFVNRRLANNASGDRGALDEALLRANLANPDLAGVVAHPNDRDTKVSTANRGRYVNVSSRLMEGAAGFIEQADLLEPLAGSLCARGDTFRIRATGASYDSDGRLLSRVTYEAIVVRSPEYLVEAAVDQSGDPSFGNSALVPPMIEAGSLRIPNPALNPLNQKFGRRFEVLSLKLMNDITDS